MSTMSVYFIIHKPEPRTSVEIFYCYEVLFKADKTVSKYLPMPSNMNEILDNLQMISKSREFLVEWCPFQFKSRYIVKCTADSIYHQIMIDGKNLHWVNQQFWQKMSVSGIQNCHKISDYIKLCDDLYRSIIPKGEITPFIDQMIQNFVSFESQRICAIIKEKGNSEEMIKLYVFPVALELAIENWENNLMGIIDRIDRLTNETYACIEYKYGKPKYLDTDWGASKIHAELAFYNLLVQGKSVYRIDEEGNGIPLLEYLGLDSLEFYYGGMIFFQDLDTALLFKITKASMSAMWKRIQNYWDRLNTGDFHPKPADACYTNCEFYEDVCEKNPEWEIIEKAMEEK